MCTEGDVGRGDSAELCVCSLSERSTTPGVVTAAAGGESVAGGEAGDVEDGPSSSMRGTVVRVAVEALRVVVVEERWAAAGTCSHPGGSAARR